MKTKMFNATHVEGLLYEHKLTYKVSGENSKNPGTPFISGEVSVATDDECLNIVTVHFTYVTAVTSSGKNNATFNLLKSIINASDRDKVDDNSATKVYSVMEHGIEKASYVKFDSAIALNDFYTTDKANNEEILVSAKRVEGGFGKIIKETELLKPEDRATFNVDMVIVGTKRKEADEEKNLPEKLILKGYIFDFRKAVMPVELSVIYPPAMDYFENLDASNKEPVFTRVTGKIVSTVVEREIKEESAFGEAKVRTVKSNNKDYIVDWAAKEPYDWDYEEDNNFLKEKMQEREVYLADKKRQQEEYKRNKDNAIANATTNPTSKKYDF